MSTEIEIVNGKTIVWQDPDIPAKDLLANDPKYIQLTEEEINIEAERIRQARSLNADDPLFQESLKLSKTVFKEHKIKLNVQTECRFFKIPGGYCIESPLIKNDNNQIYIPDEVAKLLPSLINDNKDENYKEISIKW